MLQYAAKLLSHSGNWERQNLTIESGHPGPGVRDTIEYVTGCVSAGRYVLTCDTHEARCVSDMKFSWRIVHGEQSLQLKLADGIVSPEFLRLLDKINSEEADEQNQDRLEILKQQMTQRIWSLDLEQTFPDAQLTQV
jgi:hypothetical protein